MREVIQYIADDGTIFVDEDLCREYENKEKVKDIGMRMFDQDFNELGLDGSLEDIFNEAWYLKFENEPSKEKFIELCKDYGICYDGFYDCGLLLYWSDDDNEWKDIEKRIAELNSFVERCKESGLI